MNKYPNMISEIFDAIHLMYEDDPEIEVDCYRCLVGMNTARMEEFAHRAEEEIKERNRCIQCGRQLYPYVYRNQHKELDGNPKEFITELVCPYCDLGEINE